MRRNISCFAGLLVALMVLGLGRASYADTVTLQFTGVGGANTDGYYIYPYYFNITDGNTTTDHVPLMCFSFDREIYLTNPPEQWQATLETAGQAGKQYEEVAYFLSTAVSGTPQQVIDAQLAAWYLFDPTSQTFSNMTAGAKALVNATYSDSFLSQYANDPVYLASDTSGTGPQNFVGLTPEPGTWALLGSGLIGIIAMLYFRKRSETRVGQLGF